MVAVPVPPAPSGSAGQRGGGDVEVTVVVPTRNEEPNVGVLLDRIDAAMAALGPALRWEVVFVDDSDDATPDAIRARADAGAPVLVHHRRAGARPGGLGGAVQDGFAVARGRIVAVMDADLQHPPEVLPLLLGPIMAGRADLVSGDRYSGGDGRSGLAGPWRRWVASATRWLVHGLLPRSRVLADPMSGLFAFERRRIAGTQLQAHGFKILLEVVARGEWDRVANVPYRFDRRYAGRSKASLREGWRFGRHLVRLARTPGTVGPLAMRTGAPRSVVSP